MFAEPGERPREKFKRWTSTSPSQIKTFQRCKRKWFLNKVWGWNIPFRAFNELGTMVHEIMEDYISGGRAVPKPRKERVGHPDLEKAFELAGRLYKYIAPPPAFGARQSLVEAEIKYATGVPGVSMWAYSDLTELHRDSPGVTDYKTTSHFRWCKTEEELREDPQCIIYMKFLFSKIKGDRGFFRHLYTRTKDVPKKVEGHKEVKVWVTRKENEKQWAKLLTVITEMQELSKHKGHFKEIEPN